MHIAECSNEGSNMLWRLTAEGRLQNEHTGLCATVVEGEHIWVARHPSDYDYYVAFFNLRSTAIHTVSEIDIVIRRFVASTKILKVFSSSDLHSCGMLADNTNRYPRPSMYGTDMILV